jgi:hypothetical protein
MAKGKDNASENIADYVAELLRQGRAKEVTDDLMAQADPQRLYQHYTSGNTGQAMPMDYASRVARAKDMGFNTRMPLYHGTGVDFQSFKTGMGKLGEGVYGAERTNMRMADAFANRSARISNTGPRIIPFYQSENVEPWRGEAMVSDPTNIRSPFARFDPRLDHLAHLSASTGGAMDFARHVEAVQRAGGQIAPSKYLPNVPRQVHAEGGDVEGEVDEDGITAYHGSPHSFDSFDISKLGTGEGAQAYGHGLYFAGNEAVAKGYRDSLNPVYRNVLGYAGPDKSKNAASMLAADIPEHEVISALSDLGDVDPKSSLETGRKILSNAKASGHMYKVKLNVKPEELLDWDKPLSQQHPNIQRIAREADISKAIGPTRGVLQAWREGRDVGVEATGRDLHQAISGYGEHGKQAADYLQSQGLKGIRYLDAGSRDLSDGDPTHNYVMFHHDPVQIVDKYEYGGAIPKVRDVSAALALTRRFTKDGKAATMALKPKGK